MEAGQEVQEISEEMGGALDKAFKQEIENLNNSKDDDFYSDVKIIAQDPDKVLPFSDFYRLLKQQVASKLSLL